jgi:iron complex outermembrane recepter protein
MNRNCLIRQAVRYAIAAAAASTALPVFAQEAATPTPAMEEVTVVGTRIVRKDYEATSPVVTVSEDTFKLSGEPQIETVLNTLPQLVPSITTTSNNPSNGGQANVDLRGLGTSRTLVLVDGARVTPSNVNGVVDLNTIPAALIESVEILTGGSSATYGSDAIAGVVNIKLKRSFNGIEIRAQQGMTAESDGESTLFDGVVGGNFADDRGNAVVAFSYDSRDAVLAGARDFGIYAKGPLLTPSGSGTIPEGRIDWGANSPSQAALNTVFAGYGVAAGSVSPARAIGFNGDSSMFSLGGGGQQVQNFDGNTDDPGYNPNGYTYNFGPLNYLQLPLSRKQISGSARYEMVPEVAELYTRLSFTTYHSDQQLAATPVTCSGAALGCSVPVTNAAITPALATLLNSRLVNPTAAPGTTGPASNFLFTKRFTDVGERIQENSYDVTQGIIGVKGTLPNDWHWDVYGSWGATKGVQLQDGNISRQRLQAALNNAAVYATQGCALFNPFGEGNLSAACGNAIAIKTTNILETEQKNMVASITGDLFEMPAGPFQFAAGGEYRSNTANFRPDSYLSSGDVVGFNASQPVEGEITSTEYFAELAVPLLKDIPAIKSLGLELGYRFSDYNLSESTDTYKAALKWAPVESLSVRASYNRAIRAPNILELFLPQQENFPQYSDPCNSNSTFRRGSSATQVYALCQAQGLTAAQLGTVVPDAGWRQPNAQAQAIVGGNPDLDPETADTITAGLVWSSNASSGWARNLQVSLDYFDYQIEDVISSLTSSSIIGRCFNQLDSNPTFDLNNDFCQLFNRNAGTGGIQGVQTTTLNLSALNLTGVDLSVDWRIPLGDNGSALGFKLLATNTMSVEQQETATDPFIPREGSIGQTVASAFPEWKAVLTSSYSVSKFLFRYNLRWIDAMRVVNNDAILSTPTVGLKPWVPNYFYHDVTARWTPNETWEVALGVNNIADKAPPTYTTDAQVGIQSNTDPSTYDVLGRRAFLTVGMKF